MRQKPAEAEFFHRAERQFVEEIIQRSRGSIDRWIDEVGLDSSICMELDGLSPFRDGTAWCFEATRRGAGCPGPHKDGDGDIGGSGQWI